MKLLVFILSTFVLLLALKPGLDLFVFQTDSQQTCCTDRCTQNLDNENNQKENQNNCDGKSCNPFQVCSSCALVCQHLQLINDVNPVVFLMKIASNQSTVTTQFISDFWQPPRIV